MEGKPLFSSSRILMRPGTWQPGDVAQTLERGCATCHALTRAGSVLVGNEVEVNMFNATGWSLYDANGLGAESSSEVGPPGGGARLKILKIFEFDHKRQP
jgi:hypothetical protein